MQQPQTVTASEPTRQEIIFVLELAAQAAKTNIALDMIKAISEKQILWWTMKDKIASGEWQVAPVEQTTQPPLE